MQASHSPSLENVGSSWSLPRPVFDEVTWPTGRIHLCTFDKNSKAGGGSGTLQISSNLIEFRFDGTAKDSVVSDLCQSPHLIVKCIYFLLFFEPVLESGTKLTKAMTILR